ncbi:MAG: hypothetical protein NC548_24740 [Lachnospiraceae bacterium]|nr:hypothetical protein [Lachnospiraceae bacterium]
MNIYPEQYIYDKRVWMTGDTPNSIKPTGKFPVVAEQQWETLEDAMSFINDPDSNAIPGVILSVVNDPDEKNNGIYFVREVGVVDSTGVNKKNGSMSLIACNEDLSEGIEELTNTINELQKDINEKISENVNELKLNIVELSDKHDQDIKDLTQKHDEDIEDAMLYHSNAEENWLTEPVGGVAGKLDRTKFEGKTISDVLDDILYPTLQPSITNPSVTLGYNGNNTSGQVIVVKVGSILPNENNFIKTYNRGSVTYKNADGDTYYAGSFKSDLFTMTDNAFGSVASEKRYTVSYNVTFNDGAKLLDNKGHDSTVASYKSKTTGTVYKYFDAVYPIYINTNKIDEMTEQPLKDYITSNQTLNVTIPPEKNGDLFRFEIHIPNTVTLGNVGEYNGLSSKYDIPVNMIYKGIIDKGGLSYKRYVRSEELTGAKVGGAKYEIVINKK